MQLTSRHELAFVTATLTYRGTTVEVPDVLVDTGAASIVLNADRAADAGIYVAPNVCEAVPVDAPIDGPPPIDPASLPAWSVVDHIRGRGRHLAASLQ